jgi:hypothetical protein
MFSTSCIRHSNDAKSLTDKFQAPANSVQNGMIRIGNHAALSKILFQSLQPAGKRVEFFAVTFGTRVHLASFAAASREKLNYT